MSVTLPFICQEIFTVPLAVDFGDEDPSVSTTNTTASKGPACVRFATLPQCVKVGKEKNLYFHCVEQGTISIGGSGPKPLPEPEDFPMNAYMCDLDSCPTQSPDDVPGANAGGNGGAGHEHKNGGSTSNSNTGQGNSAQKGSHFNTKTTLVGILVFAMLLPQMLAA